MVNPRQQNTTRTISCKAWNSPVEYPSTESKHDINVAEGNMLNPMLNENVQGNIQEGFTTAVLKYRLVGES